MMDMSGDEIDPTQDRSRHESSELEVHIRYAAFADLAEVSALFRDVVGGSKIYNEASRQRELVRFCEPALEAIVAKDSKAISLATVHPSKAIVGFCIAINQPAKTWIEAGKIWIEWLGTDIKMRRNNIGQSLINHLIADAPSRGATKVTCSTITKNRASMALFEKAGFKRYRTLRNQWYGQDMHFFERIL